MTGSPGAMCRADLGAGGLYDTRICSAPGTCDSSVLDVITCARLVSWPTPDSKSSAARPEEGGRCQAQ
jgi:hypothetical protein